MVLSISLTLLVVVDSASLLSQKLEELLPPSNFTVGSDDGPAVLHSLDTSAVAVVVKL